MIKIIYIYEAEMRMIVIDTVKVGNALCSEHVVKSGLSLNLRRFALAHTEEFDEICHTLRLVPFLITRSRCQPCKRASFFCLCVSPVPLIPEKA